MRARTAAFGLLFALAAAHTANAQDLAPGTLALRPEHVDAAAGKRMGKVKRCYGDALAKSPRLFGVIGIGMAVAPDGTVADRWITIATTGDAELERCILRAFEGLTLPAPGEPGAVARYGMLLTNDETSPEAAKAQEDAYRKSSKGS